MKGNLLTIVPARGGSKRLRRKNLLPIDGVPLFLRPALIAPGRIVVSTDDDEIASMARVRGYEVHRREGVGSDQTIAEMAMLVAEDLIWEDDVLVVQPTVHPLDRHELWAMVRYGRDRDVSLVASYHIEHNQWLADRTTGIDFELGVYFWPAGAVGDPPDEHWELGEGPFFDIDTPSDFRSASFRQRSIAFDAAAASTWTGTGHARRAETLALALQHHAVSNEYRPSSKWDMYIRDKGNSTPADILPHILRGERVISFEDYGPGARYADLVVNAFVPPLGLPNERTGPDWAVIRPEFVSLPQYSVREFMSTVLVVFGGTDARNLASLVGETIGHLPLKLVFHEGPGIAEAMLGADLLISGAGQVVHEAALVGVPTVVISATLREACHTHLGPEHGNVFLGSAADLSPERLTRTVDQLRKDWVMRREMSNRARARIDGKGLQRIVHEIEGMFI